MAYLTGPEGCVTKEMKGKRQGHSLGKGREAGFSSSRQARCQRNFESQAKGLSVGDTLPPTSCLFFCPV